MVTAALLSGDQRLAFQVHTWMKEVSETVRLKTFTDLADFVAKVEEKPDEDKDKKDSAEILIDAEDIGSGKSTDPQAEKYFRLLIVDLEFITSKGAKPLSWTAEIKKLLSAHGKSDPVFPTKVMFMAFEGSEWGAENLRNPDIDDLVVKPLDRSVFLQKIEILCADKLNIKPSFLFRQKADIPIEVGKDATIDEISDFGMAIRNPAPLASGVFAAIHSDIFGGQGDSRILGRAYKSERHPTIEGEYIVRFNFFGASNRQIANIKKILREHHVATKLKNHHPNVPHTQPTTPFNRVAIVDMDRGVFDEIQSALQGNYHGLAVSYFPSYVRFLAAVTDLGNRQKEVATKSERLEAPAPRSSDIATSIAASGQASENAPESAEKPDRPWPQKRPLIYTISSTTAELVSFESGVSANELVFGRRAMDWLERSADWLSRLETDDLEEYNQLIDYARSGAHGRAYVRISDEAETVFYFEASAKLERAGESETHDVIRVELRDMGQEDWETHAAVGGVNAAAQHPEDFRFDAIYIDGSLIRDDLQTFYTGLEELLLRNGVHNQGEPMPKIIVLADEKSKAKPEDYRSNLVSDFMYKPLDRRSVALKAKTVVNELIPLKDEPGIYVPIEEPAKLAKDIMMEEISEYGLSVAHKTPFRTGVTMRFFSSLFGEGVGGVIGRCSHCELVKKDKSEYYLCHFIFFGAADDTLQRIRRWIREDYVHRKEGS